MMLGKLMPDAMYEPTPDARAAQIEQARRESQCEIERLEGQVASARGLLQRAWWELRVEPQSPLLHEIFAWLTAVAAAAPQVPLPPPSQAPQARPE